MVLRKFLVMFQITKTLKFTLGIANVDKSLVLELAERGKGKCEILSSMNLSQLEPTMLKLMNWYYYIYILLIIYNILLTQSLSALSPAFDEVSLSWVNSAGKISTQIYNLVLVK